MRYLTNFLPGGGLSYKIFEKQIVVIKGNRLKPSAVITKGIEEERQADTYLRGSVKDINGEPLIGVSVVLKGGIETGTLTDINGKYQLKAKAGQKVVFSYIGFQLEEVTIPSSLTIDVILKETPQDLDEVVVVAYGTQKKVNLTGSIGIVSGKDIAIKPMGQTSAALQGVLSGVTVKQTSGQPGSDGGSIRIRGIGTINDASPLVIIDGVEGGINNVDPNTIESMSVLKDAASSSIYGSRAANGVILITTKRGKSGKFTVSYNNYFGWQKATDIPELVDAVGHVELLNTAYKNVGKTPLYDDALVEAYRQQNGANSDQYPNTDWQKGTLTGSGFQQQHFVNISGGTDNIKLFTSVGYFSQDGLVERSSFERLSLRNNMDWKLSSKFNARLDINFVKNQTSSPSTAPSTVFQWMNSIPANQIGVN